MGKRERRRPGKTKIVVAEIIGNGKLREERKIQAGKGEDDTDEQTSFNPNLKQTSPELAYYQHGLARVDSVMR